MGVSGRVPARALARALVVAAFAFVCFTAYDIRMQPVRYYGHVIRDFDPYFNFKATRYLVENGYTKFNNWFDETVWWPLGRPVNTTMFPGMQYCSAAIYHAIHRFGGGGFFTGQEVTIEQVTCESPAYLAMITVMAVAGMAYEASGYSVIAALFTGYFSATTATHLTRSMACDYDNESHAMPLLALAFLCWMMAAREEHAYNNNKLKSWLLPAIGAGVFHGFCAYTWGGYIMIHNIIGVSVLLDVLTTGYRSHVNKAYCVYYICATYIALHVPIVEDKPLRSLEQLGPLGMCLFLQVWAYCERVFARHPVVYGGSDGHHGYKGDKALARLMLRLKAFAVVGVVSVALGYACIPSRYFGPLSSRVRQLVIPAAHTGNPLVDSVTEHKGMSPRGVWSELNLLGPLVVVGYMTRDTRLSASRFLTRLALAFLFITIKMSRFLVVLSIPAAAFAGMGVDFVVSQFLREWAPAGLGLDRLLLKATASDASWVPLVLNRDENTAGGGGGGGGGSGGEESKPSRGGLETSGVTYVRTMNIPLLSVIQKVWKNMPALARKALCLAAVIYLGTQLTTYRAYSHRVADGQSHPFVVAFSDKEGHAPGEKETSTVDAGLWLRDNTPEDSRVFSWWDYGYHLAVFSRRTTLADGNTWNHEHIGLIGRIYTSPIEEAHAMIRHLADYVYVKRHWHGDMGISWHFAKIGESVFPGQIDWERWHYLASDGVSRGKWLELQKDGKWYQEPTPMVGNSLVYHLTYKDCPYNYHPKYARNFSDYFVEERPDRESKFRIYRVVNPDPESKAYGNKHHSYPPKLKAVLDTRKDFKQLEDFNQKDD